MTPTTPTTHKSCCEKCGFDLIKWDASVCPYTNCPCHSSSTQDGHTHEWIPTEDPGPLQSKCKCGMYSTNPAPQHTSPDIVVTARFAGEKTTNIYRAGKKIFSDTSPENEIPGVGREFHERAMGLMFAEKEIDPNQMMHDLHNEIDHIQSTPSFTEKTLDPAEYIRAGKALGILEGKRQERTRILAAIEKRKEVCLQNCTDYCDVIDWNEDLDALAAELQK